ncbi:hypothetical protein [Streptomyces sp. DSM 41534]
MSPDSPLLLLTPLLVIFSPLLVLYTLLRTARLVAVRIFHDAPIAPVPVRDGTLDRVKLFRMWVAIGVSVAVAAVFGTAWDAAELVSDGWTTLLVTPWLLIATAPVVITLLILCAPRHRRPAMRTALRVPLRKLACFIGTLVFVPALITVMALTNPSRVGGSLGTWLGLACVAAGAWSVFLFLFSSAAVARTGFGVAAVHPALPALLTSVLVWELAAIGGLPAGPPPIAYTMLIGGPAVVTAIAWWEIHRLRTRYGVLLRGG